MHRKLKPQTNEWIRLDCLLIPWLKMVGIIEGFWLHGTKKTPLFLGGDLVGRN